MAFVGFLLCVFFLVVSVAPAFMRERASQKFQIRVWLFVTIAIGILLVVFVLARVAGFVLPLFWN